MNVRSNKIRIRVRPRINYAVLIEGPRHWQSRVRTLLKDSGVPFYECGGSSGTGGDRHAPCKFERSGCS